MFPIRIAFYSIFLAASTSWPAFAQNSEQISTEPSPAPQFLLSEQLNELVAPIALYPDPLLSQILAASTYPLEIVEAQQWLQQTKLPSQQLIEAAKQQNWDPSVQALVAFPSVLTLLNRNIRWTTNLGNAFLSQQTDVMDAIQRLRAQAADNGRLTSTPQQTVLSKTQNDQTAIRIEPADPQVIYPPVYDPSYVWEPPVSGAYSQQPSSYAWGSPSPRGYPQQQGYDSGRYPQQQGYDSGGYPQQQGYESRGYPQQQGYDSGGWNSGGGSGLNFGQAVNVAQTFSGLLGLGGWGGWGWAINWFTHNVLLNGSFFNLFGFHDSGGGFLQSAVWTHDPVHRGHVPYPYSFSPRAYNRGGFSAQVTAPHTRWYAPSPSSEWHRFQGSPSAQSYSRGAFSDYSHAGVAGRYNAPPQTNYGRDYRGSSNSALQARGSSYGGQASVGRAPGFSYSAPRAFQSQFSGRSSGSQHFSAPRVSAPRSSSHFSAPKGSSHFSFGHRSGSSGGHSGGRSRSHPGKSHKR